MIELKNVSKYYNNDGVVTLGLRNINLKLHKNEIVAIVGDSGSGKSTLLNVICGVDTYEDGEMYFKGNETSYFNQDDMDQYRKEKVGFIYQNYNIIDSYTVLENVMLPMILKGVSKNDAKKRALELIEKVGLSHRIKNRGTNLSGGEKQRCVIARALASDCDILACDEPTGNLDSKSGMEIIKLIKEVAKDKLVLIVTHNYEEVEDIITRKIKIADGTVVEDHIISKVEDEEKEDIIFTQESVKKRDLFKIAFKNIKSTPKKTIFTFVVFLFISLVTFYLYLSCMGSSEVSVFNPDTSFHNYEYNRLVVFDYDHSKLDNDYWKVDGMYYENAFYEDIPFKLTLRQDGQNPVDVYTTYTKYTAMTYNLISGREIIWKNQEAFIIFPKDRLDHYSILASNHVGGWTQVGDAKLNFVGFGSSEYVKSPVIISSVDLTEPVKKLTYGDYLSLDLYIPTLDKTVSIARRTNIAVSYPTLYLPYAYAEYEEEFVYNFMLGGLYNLATPRYIQIQYIYGNSNCFFLMPKNYDYKFDEVYEVVLYADRPNEAVKELEDMKYTVIRPSIDYTEVSQNQLLFIAYVAISTIIVIIIGFVSQAVLSRIYISKNKDYTVLRSLGVVKKKMSFVVTVEIISIAFVSIALAFVFMYIADFMIDSSYLDVIKYNKVGVTLLYFGVMTLYSFYVARRFNKRLFKFSVQSTFKSEVIRND